MRLREIMRSPVVTVGADASARSAWSLMKRRRIRHLVVTEGAHLIGVLSERDLDREGGPRIAEERLVQDVMSSSVATAGPNSTLRQAANLMWGRQIGSLPVLDRNRLVGIVTATDVLEVLGRGSSRPKIRAERYTLRLPASSKQIGGRPVVRRRPRGAAHGRRGRPRKADSKKRAPIPGSVSKSLKRQLGGAAAGVAAHIRSLGSELDRDDRAYIRRKLGMKLGKFAPAIERISVRVEDVNGPRGGIDQVCRVKVVLSGAPSVVFESRDASLQTAIDAALAGAERGVRRSLKRRRVKPMKATKKTRFEAAVRDSQEELEHVSQMVSTSPHGRAEPEQHRA